MMTQWPGSRHTTDWRNRAIGPQFQLSRLVAILAYEGENMKLLTKEIKKNLPALYSQEEKGMEAVAHVKFFNPCGAATWYATEYRH